MCQREVSEVWYAGRIEAQSNPAPEVFVRFEVALARHGEDPVESELRSLSGGRSGEEFGAPAGARSGRAQSCVPRA